jgi:uncharacterized protein (DUF362 family)
MIMGKRLGRREFFKKSAKIGLGYAGGRSFLAWLGKGSSQIFAGEKAELAVGVGSDYFKAAVKAAELLGGMKNFVPKGASVALLPNVQSRHPGAFTNPEIFRAVIRLCREAGAREINVLSWQDQKQWEDTGLGKVAAEESANLKLFPKDETLFKAVSISSGKFLTEAKILNEFFSNDVFINMPVTKDHAGNKFTGKMKNIMGLNSPASNRTFHRQNWKTDPSDLEHLDQCIVDLNKAVKPTLNVVDATEIIITNGPFGPGELLKPEKVVAGVDRVAVDSYCAALWGMKGEDIIMIRRGYEQGLGEINLKKINIKEAKI